MPAAITLRSYVLSTAFPVFHSFSLLFVFAPSSSFFFTWVFFTYHSAARTATNRLHLPPWTVQVTCVSPFHRVARS
jgi:hypothetical protein